MKSFFPVSITFYISITAATFRPQCWASQPKHLHLHLIYISYLILLTHIHTPVPNTGSNYDAWGRFVDWKANPAVRRQRGLPTEPQPPLKIHYIGYFDISYLDIMATFPLADHTPLADSTLEPQVAVCGTAISSGRHNLLTTDTGVFKWDCVTHHHMNPFTFFVVLTTLVVLVG